jgi:hypothetical protein|tara:strand:- start:1766 stop:2272 length:507 start_codon:yes stop_codon:yes gene_type:complete
MISLQNYTPKTYAQCEAMDDSERLTEIIELQAVVKYLTGQVERLESPLNVLIQNAVEASTADAVANHMKHNFDLDDYVEWGYLLNHHIDWSEAFSEHFDPEEYIDWAEAIHNNFEISNYESEIETMIADAAHGDGLLDAADLNVKIRSEVQDMITSGAITTNTTLEVN